MEDIKDVYAIQPGKTYWVCVGTKDITPSQDSVDKIKNFLVTNHPENKWIVTDALTRPVMVNSTKGKNCEACSYYADCKDWEYCPYNINNQTQKNQEVD